MVRSIKELSEIATTGTVLKVAKAVFNEIEPEDNVPFYEDFVQDVNELEGLNGPLEYQSELRNRLVTCISENYIPKEPGMTVCPACVAETPNKLAICIRCTGY